MAAAVTDTKRSNAYRRGDTDESRALATRDLPVEWDKAIKALTDGSP